MNNPSLESKITFNERLAKTEAQTKNKPGIYAIPITGSPLCFGYSEKSYIQAREDAQSRGYQGLMEDLFLIMVPDPKEHWVFITA